MNDRAARAACIALLACLPFALYGINLDDYFVGDDFDFLVSIHEQPAAYFAARLWDNESGSVWRDAGFDSAQGRGYLRPVKIWLLKLNELASGTSPFGYHLTSTLVFSALSVCVFLLLDALLPGRRPFALLGAAAAALHPTFAEVVPFITARDEALAALFGVAAVASFVRFRERGRSPLPWYALYALALLSKESALPYAAIPLGYDLAMGTASPRTREGRLRLVRAHAPIALIALAYLGLRFVAFGNVRGGDVAETHFASPAAFVHFHGWLFRSLVAPSQLALPWPRAVGIATAAAAAAGTAWLLVRGDRRHARLLLFLGPVWYLGATALLHGTYFTTRHHGMAVIGLAMFGSALLAGVGGRLSPVRQWAVCAALVVVCAAAFVPPAYGLARSYDAAAGVTARVRAAIDEQTRHLPDGCAVRITGVPQWTERPWYFGWGLRSALSRPFTPGDLANRCVVVNDRNLELTGARFEIPERFDLVIDIDTRTVERPRRHLPAAGARENDS
jgi:hypothetical protein